MIILVLQQNYVILFWVKRGILRLVPTNTSSSVQKYAKNLLQKYFAKCFPLKAGCMLVFYFLNAKILYI